MRHTKITLTDALKHIRELENLRNQLIERNSALLSELARTKEAYHEANIKRAEVQTANDLLRGDLNNSARRIDELCHVQENKLREYEDRMERMQRRHEDQIDKLISVAATLASVA